MFYLKKEKCKLNKLKWNVNYAVRIQYVYYAILYHVAVIRKLPSFSCSGRVGQLVVQLIGKLIKQLVHTTLFDSNSNLCKKYAFIGLKREWSILTFQSDKSICFSYVYLSVSELKPIILSNVKELGSRVLNKTTF